MANAVKSPNMISATGRMPVIAAPTAVPTMVDSDIGVSLTLSSPNSWARVSVTLKAPPQYRPMSSPSRKTDASLVISSLRASRSASLYVIFLMNILFLSVNVFQCLFWRWVWAFDRELHCFFNLCGSFFFNLFDFAFGKDLVLERFFFQSIYGVFGQPFFNLLFRPVLGRINAGVSSTPA